MVSYIEGTDRAQVSLLPACVDDYVASDSRVRVVDAFVASLNLTELGCGRTVAAATGRPGFNPGDMLRLAHRQFELERRDEKVLVFGEPDAYGLWPGAQVPGLQSPECG